MRTTWLCTYVLICCLPVIIWKCDTGAWWTRVLHHMPAPLSSFPCGEEQEAVITIKAFPSATSTRALTECSRAAWTWSANQHPLIHLFNQVGQIKSWMASSWMTWWIVFASYTNCIGFAKDSNTSLLGNKNGESEMNGRSQQDMSNPFYWGTSHPAGNSRLHAPCNTS